MAEAVVFGVCTSVVWVTMMASFSFYQEAAPSQKGRYAIAAAAFVAAFSGMFTATVVLIGRAIVAGD